VCGNIIRWVCQFSTRNLPVIARRGCLQDEDVGFLSSVFSTCTFVIEITESEMDKKVAFAFVTILVFSGIAYYLYNNQKISVNSEPVAVSEDSVLYVVDIVSDDTASIEKNLQNIEIEGGSFYFKPNEIKVKAGEKVKITFKNIEGFHDFVIDELNVKTKQIKDGEVDVVEFTPTLSGSYEFYCSIGNHRSMGMKGILIVE